MKINTIFVDSSDTSSELCLLGEKYNTDKSPLNTDGHRHPYTAIYNLLFANLKYQKICFGEVGILNNASMKCWREFFSCAKLFGYEYDENYIEQAKQHNLNNTFYHFINVKNSEIIKSSLSLAKELFDVLIDDSTHEFDDQIRFMNIAYRYLKPGGILIIEDIFRDFDQNLYEENLKSISKYFSHASFFITEHKNRFSPSWNNDKLLILFRNDEI